MTPTIHLCRDSHHVPVSHIAAAVYIEGKHQDFSVGQAPSVGNKGPQKVRYVTLTALFSHPLLQAKPTLCLPTYEYHGLLSRSLCCLEMFGSASGRQEEHSSYSDACSACQYATQRHLVLQGCQSRGRLQVVAAEKQGAPTTTKKRTTGPPILPPINDDVSHLCTSVPGAFTLLIPP